MEVIGLAITKAKAPVMFVLEQNWSAKYIKLLLYVDTNSGF
jgi:hypothetical protein